MTEHLCARCCAGRSDPAQRSRGTWHPARQLRKRVRGSDSRDLPARTLRLSLLGFRVSGAAGGCGQDRGQATLVAGGCRASGARFARKRGLIESPRRHPVPSVCPYFPASISHALQ